jgi:hypothetical protein
VSRSSSKHVDSVSWASSVSMTTGSLTRDDGPGRAAVTGPDTGGANRMGLGEGEGVGTGERMSDTLLCRGEERG